MRGQAFSFVILCRATLTFAKPPEPIVSFTSAGGERRHDMHDHALKMLAISGGYTASFDIGRRDRRGRNEEERGEKNRKLPLSSAPLFFAANWRWPRPRGPSMPAQSRTRGSGCRGTSARRAWPVSGADWGFLGGILHHQRELSPSSSLFHKQSWLHLMLLHRLRL